MSTTMQGIDARGYLSGWMNALVNMYQADIRATPDDKWTATFGGCSRPASEVTADALAMLAWTTGALKGQAPDDYEEALIEGMKAACATKEGAATKLQVLAQEFTAALMEASEESLQKEVVPPWKMPTPLFMLAQIAVSHVWYHDGQLNYIQCLYGDDKVHWMGD